MPVRIFISHAHEDADIVSSIVDLLLRAFNLSQEDIRCTSVDGFKYPGGVRIEEVLRNEVLNSELLISILTPVSLKSIYVLFELGARWGKERPIIPVLSKGLSPESVRQSPLFALNLIEMSEETHVYQLLEDASKIINVEIAKRSSLHNLIKKVVACIDVGTMPETSIDQPASPAFTGLNDEEDQRKIDILSCFDGDDEMDLYDIVKLKSLNVKEARYYLDEMVKDGLVEIVHEDVNLRMYKITHDGRGFWVKGQNRENVV